ncbi:MAG: phosphotransferase [Xanthomonadaceae bacterium]|nr:phosphotransferase [Xanthomonadaceae bacterium]
MSASTSQTEIPLPLRILIEDYLNVQDAHPPTSFSASCLAGDGSDRKYYRVQTCLHEKQLIAVDASHGWGKFRQINSIRVTENHSFMYLAQHLSKLGFPVPQVLSSSLDCGYYLLEDLGTTTLYDLINGGNCDTDIHLYYRQALKLLIKIQHKATLTFKPSWCYAGGHYDRKLIISRELEYFLKSFAIPFGNISLSNAEQKNLALEFNQLADQALEAPGRYFLYRDYQSKNLMIKDGRIWLIDFQGARLGPPYYDLASLINDPYASLPFRLRNELLDYYYEHAAGPLSLPQRQRFNHFFALYSLIRGLQVLGAFGFLSSQKKRLHFRSYIPRALGDIKRFSADLQVTDKIPALGQLISKLSFKL